MQWIDTWHRATHGRSACSCKECSTVVCSRHGGKRGSSSRWPKRARSLLQCRRRGCLDAAQVQQPLCNTGEAGLLINSVSAQYRVHPCRCLRREPDPVVAPWHFPRLAVCAMGRTVSTRLLTPAGAKERIRCESNARPTAPEAVRLPLTYGSVPNCIISTLMYALVYCCGCRCSRLIIAMAAEE